MLIVVLIGIALLYLGTQIQHLESWGLKWMLYRGFMLVWFFYLGLLFYTFGI